MVRASPAAGRLSALVILALLLASSWPHLPAVSAHGSRSETIEYEERVLEDVNDDMSLFPDLVDIVALDVGELYIVYAGGSYIYFKAIVRYNWNPNATIAQSVNLSFARNGEPVNISMFTANGGDWVSPEGYVAGFFHSADPREKDLYFVTTFRALGLAKDDILTNFTMESRATVLLPTGNQTTIVADRAPEGTYVAASPADVPIGLPKQAPPTDDLLNQTSEEEPFGGWQPTPENLTSIEPTSGMAFRLGEHIVTDGTNRFTATLEPAVRWIGIREKAHFTITVESAMKELDQRVLIFGRPPRAERWGATMEGDQVRDLPPGGTVQFNVTLAPSVVDPAPTLDLPVVVLSSLGGFAVLTLKARIRDLVTDPDLFQEPRHPRVEFLNANDRFRVNESRLLMFNVVDQNDIPFASLTGVQLLVHPQGRPEQGVNYALDRKVLFEGVYQIAYIFPSSGPWVLNLTIFDDPGRPHTVFTVDVSPTPDPPHIIPPALVLGLLLGGGLLIALRTRLRLLLQKWR